MPPKHGTKKTEDKEAAFQVFKQTEEYKQYFRFIAAKDADPETKNLELSTMDISSDWTRVLTELRKLMEICKVPKTKVLEQEYIRTMFFEKLKENQLTVTFDGEEYSVSQAANVDIWSCRQHLAQEIWPKFDINDIEEQCTASNFKTFKADVFKVLRKWEGMYSKHQRFTNPEIAAIHQKVVQPL